MRIDLNSQKRTFLCFVLQIGCILMMCKVVAPIIVVSICFTSELPNYDRIIGALLEHGLAELSKHCYLTPGNLLWNLMSRSPYLPSTPRLQASTHILRTKNYLLRTDCFQQKSQDVKWFEFRSISYLSCVITQARVVFRKTVVGD